MLQTSSEQLNRQGNEHFSRGYYTEAYVCYAKALECDRLSGDRRAMAATLGNLGNICAVSGRREQAKARGGLGLLPDEPGRCRTCRRRVAGRGRAVRDGPVL